MAKDLTGNLTTELATDEHRPIELYTIYLDDYTLYFTDHDENVDFYDIDGDAQTFVAVALTRSDVKTYADSKIDSVKIRLDNVNKTMSTYIKDYEFRGRRAIVMRVYEDYLTDSDDYITIFDGLMDNPVIGETSLEVAIKSRLGTLTKRVPRRMFQVYCNFEFGDSDTCKQDKVTTGVSGVTVIAGSTTSAVRVSGSAYENLSDDYYKYGTIEVTAGSNIRETRLVVYSSGTHSLTGISGIQLGLGYNFASSPINDTVTVQQGCDKTLATCNTKYSNTANYGGYPTIPQGIIRRS